MDMVSYFTPKVLCLPILHLECTSYFPPIYIYSIKKAASVVQTVLISLQGQTVSTEVCPYLSRLIFTWLRLLHVWVKQARRHVVQGEGRVIMWMTIVLMVLCISQYVVKGEVWVTMWMTIVLMMLCMSQYVLKGEVRVTMWMTIVLMILCMLRW